MPYITQEQKDFLLNNESGQNIPRNAGELNFFITMILVNYWEDKDPSYQRINDIIGALESAKAEFQRRIVAPYEDAKMSLNGDVYFGENDE